MKQEFARVIDRNEELTRVEALIGDEWFVIASGISVAKATQIAGALNGIFNKVTSITEALLNLECCSCGHKLKSHTATGVAAEAGFPCVEQSPVASAHTSEEGTHCRCTRGTFSHTDLLAVFAA